MKHGVVRLVTDDAPRLSGAVASLVTALQTMEAQLLLRQLLYFRVWIHLRERGAVLRRMEALADSALLRRLLDWRTFGDAVCVCRHARLLWRHFRFVL